MQNTEIKIPLRTIIWVIDKQNFKAIPFVINETETKAKNLLTDEVLKLDNKSLTRAYAKQKGVELDLVHVGKINALTNYITCGVSLSKLMQAYYTAIKAETKDVNTVKYELATKLFMDKAVDKLELSRIEQDLTMGTVRLHTASTKQYFKEKELKELEAAARKF